MSTRLLKESKHGTKLERLTSNEQRFVLELLAAGDWNLTEAVRKAYPKCKNPAQYATKLMHRPRIKAYLGKIQHQDVQRLELDRHETLRQLYYALTRKASDFVNPDTGIGLLPHQLPERVQSIVDGFEQEIEEFETDDGRMHRRVKMKYKITPHATAREQAMKHKGLFEADHEQSGKVIVNWDQLLSSPGDNGHDEIAKELKSLEE